MTRALWIVFLAAIAGFAARAQPTRMLEEFDFGEDALVARLYFVELEGPELCVALGTRRGPRTLNPVKIFVTRRVRPNQKGYSGRLKFDFRGEPDDDTHDYLRIWHSCIPTPGAAPEDSEEDVLEVTVRGAQENGENSRFFTNYPSSEKGTGVAIFFNNVGGLAGGFFEHPVNPDDPLAID